MYILFKKKTKQKIPIIKCNTTADYFYDPNFNAKQIYFINSGVNLPSKY